MFNNILKPILIFIPLTLIQLTIIPMISIDGIVPNLVFILIAFYTLKNGQAYGVILGFCLGFFLDLFSSGLIGAFMLSFTISAFMVGYFYNENKFELNTESYFFLLIIFLCGSLNAFIYAVVSNSNPSINIFFLILEEGILPGLYTSLFGLPIIIFTPKKGIL